MVVAAGPAMKLAMSRTLSPEKMFWPDDMVDIPRIDSVSRGGAVVIGRRGRLSGPHHPPAGSAPRELRLAFLQEGVGPFLQIFSGGAKREEGRFELQAFALAHLGAVMHRLQREPHRHRRI